LNGRTLILSVILQDTENLCNDIFQKFDNIPYETLDNISDLKDRIEGVKKSVSVSKKKFMVRTEKGKELSNHAKTTAMEIRDSLDELLKNQGSETSEKHAKSVLTNLERLEKDAQKVEMYWRSYEAAIT
jgi:hypothetical protein